MIPVDFDRVDLDANIIAAARQKGLLEPLNNVPVQNAGDYKGVAVDVTGEANGEPLVDARDYGIASVPYYLKQAESNPTYNKNIKGAPDVNWVRRGTAEKLQAANGVLNELGLELVVLDSHRSPVTQNILFEAFKEKFYEKKGCGVAQKHGGQQTAAAAEKRRLYAEQAKKFALEFCSSAENFNAKDSKTWTIHSTGGAVDVYMLDKKSGKVVDMGEGYFDNPAPVTHTRHYEDKDPKTLSEKEKSCLYARRILYNTMTKLGFVNYGYECFHYSYQDPYWACVKGVPAKYGYIESPKDRTLSKLMGALLKSAGRGK